MTYDNVILDNDKTVSFYGISDQGEIILIHNPYQNLASRMEADMVDLQTWLNYLNNDYESSHRFLRDVNYIIDKLHEHEAKPYAMELTEQAMQYVRRCYDRTLKLRAAAEQLSQKYTLLSSDLERFYRIIQENYNKQVDVRNRTR